MLRALSVLLGGVQKLSQAFFLFAELLDHFCKCIVGLANLPNTPWDRRDNLMNFKNWHMSAIEPIRFVTPLFNFLEVEFDWSSPMSNVQRFSLWAAQDLNDLVSRRDLQIFRLHSVSILWGDTAPPKKNVWKLAKVPRNTANQMYPQGLCTNGRLQPPKLLQIPVGTWSSCNILALCHTQAHCKASEECCSLGALKVMAAATTKLNTFCENILCQHSFSFLKAARMLTT